MTRKQETFGRRRPKESHREGEAAERGSGSVQVPMGHCEERPIFKLPQAARWIARDPSFLLLPSLPPHRNGKKGRRAWSWGTGGSKETLLPSPGNSLDTLALAWEQDTSVLVQMWRAGFCFSVGGYARPRVSRAWHGDLPRGGTPPRGE